MSAISFSYAEVTSIDPLGFSLQCGPEALYLPFAEFPGFEHATVAQIARVVCAGSSRLYWPELDLDLTVDAIRNRRTVEFMRSGHNS